MSVIINFLAYKAAKERTGQHLTPREAWEKRGFTVLKGGVCDDVNKKRG